MKIDGKIIVVTGASGGIGAAIARAMVKEGANQIVLLARNEGGLQEVADEIETKDCKIKTYSVDLSDFKAVESATQSVLKDIGVPDILINNAGSGKWRFLHESDAEEVEQVMAVPYFAAAWVTQQFLPEMLERGSGHIVNISSVVSRLAWPGATAYIAACRAMRGFSDALRADLCYSGIGVTHYESGPIDSSYWKNNPNSRERVPKVATMLIPTLSENQAAISVVVGIRRNKNFVVVPRMLKFVYLLNFTFPWLVQWLMTRTGYRQP